MHILDMDKYAVHCIKIIFFAERHTGVFMKKSLRYLTSFSAFISLWMNSAFSQASYWDEYICSHSLSGTNIDPGSSFTAAVSVGAQRTETSIIPVSYFFSTTPSVTGSSQLLGSANTLVQQPGSYCSSIVNKTLTMPTTSNDEDCMATTSAYIVFKTGEDEASTPVSLLPNATYLPTISSFSPASGKIGTVIQITGAEFDAYTKVYFGNIQAPSWFVSDTQLGAVVPAGATTGAVTVKRVDTNFQFCVPTGGVSSVDFEVEDEYCDSGAQYGTWGRIKYVASSGDFTNDLSSSSECPMYSDYTGNIGYKINAVRGSSKNIAFKLDSCGLGEMYKLVKAYIDWNADGDFSDPGEFIFQHPSALNDIEYQANISIPSSATVGVTRMRIINAAYIGISSIDDITSCSNYLIGETQDYTLEILPN